MYYYKAICAIVFISIMSVITALPSSSDIELFSGHYQRVNNYECSIPQPRVFRINELLPEDELQLSASTYFLPRVTVLHRCDKDTGCCMAQDQICSPKNIDDVDLVFHKIFRNENGKTGNKYIHVTAQNHTLCTCKSTTVSIK